MVFEARASGQFSADCCEEEDGGTKRGFGSLEDGECGRVGAGRDLDASDFSGAVEIHEV